jgi:signal transduction histidine kinase/CheY-like chemotaxis protein
MVISAIQNLYGADGRYYGILVLDVDMSWFAQYTQSLSRIAGSYGVIVNQDMMVVSHPYEEWLGEPLRALGPDYAQIAAELPQNETIHNRRITDTDGQPAMVYFRQLFNGWYVALVTPLESYYHDLYTLEINPAFMGIILVLLFSLVMLRITANQIRSDEVSSYKSAFLAQMSHEIRTPMNAVLGMSELALREEDHARVLEYVGGIKQAGHDLLAIINDVLDVSRIETGTLRITPVSYYLASLLNDVISMIRVQVPEKPVVFTVNVDANIPNALVGDETRVKQVLINLLSNAVKFTHEGHISLTIRAGYMDNKKISFTFEIADSGIGIKKEDIPHLFENFARFDAVKNRGVEGTGLGLVITRNLCRAMGGDVSVSSEYGKGSVFTATLVQKFDAADGLAVVENPADKRVLCFEERERYARSLAATMENLGVYAVLVDSREAFFRELAQGNYTFAFVSSGLVEEAASRIQAGSLRTALVLLANPGELASHQNIPMVVMPAYAVPVANVLNRRTIYERRKQRRIQFTAPEARILIVDDIATNLKVAEGLLSLYQPQVDTCLDGRSAVEMVRQHHYDLVFMDHMMPGMDGIEATAAIRALNAPATGGEANRFKTLPIIALTANAVFGMREMFLSKGFNDYLPKPIEITKLDEIMAKWIPRAKQMENQEAAQIKTIQGDEQEAADTLAPVAIEGINTGMGLAMSGAASWTDYCDILSLYCRDAVQRFAALRTVPAEEELLSFTTQVHALKSASASIGAAGVSQMAAALEAAGKAGDLKFIGDNLDAYYAELVALVERIGAALNAGGGTDTDGAAVLGAAERAQLTRLRTALEAEDIKRIDLILDELKAAFRAPDLKRTLDDIAGDILMSEFKAAIARIDGLLA